MDQKGWILRLDGYVKVQLWGIGVQVPISQAQIAGVCVNDDGSGGGGGCPMGWVHLNGARIGHVGHI